jgi:DNA polymerase-3 subunit gamma/tau
LYYIIYKNTIKKDKGNNTMKSLAVKYRPSTFEAVCGNTTTVRILKRVLERNAPKNAYLFAGPSGCGKTTLARCFANALNQGIGEPIEIDAASNNGVDQVRAIVESANQRSLTGTYKIYIIDECHAITSAGWQAFLKGIEETPEYTIFIFCTTEPNKIPATILNRVQRFNISKIDSQEVKARLEYICQQEGFTNYSETCELISKLCNGGMRDAITMLDQCADFSADLALENTKAVLGEAPFERMLKLTNCLIGGNEQFTLAAIDTLAAEGRDLKQFIDDYLSFVLELTKYILFKNIGITNIPAYLENSADNMISVNYTTSFEGALAWFNALTDKLLEIKSAIKYDTAVKAVIEAYLLQVCRRI